MKYPRAIISNKFFSQLVVVVVLKVVAVVNIVVVVEVVLIFNI